MARPVVLGVHAGARVVVAATREDEPVVLADVAAGADLGLALAEATRAARQAFGDDVEARAVVTIPAGAHLAARKRAMRAAELAGLSVLALVRAPLAVAAAYAPAAGREEVLGVYAWDGARFEYALCARAGATWRVLASAGDDALGAPTDAAVRRSLELAWKAHIRERRAARDVARVLLAGAHAAFPAVRAAVEAFFHKAPLASVAPEHAAAFGAALRASAIAAGRGVTVFPPEPDTDPSASPGFAEDEAPTLLRRRSARPPREEVSIEIVLDDLLDGEAPTLAFELADPDGDAPPAAALARVGPRPPSTRPPSARPPGAFFSYVGPYPAAPTSAVPDALPRSRGSLWDALPEERSWVEVPAPAFAPVPATPRGATLGAGVSIQVDGGDPEELLSAGAELPCGARRMLPARADGATATRVRLAQDGARLGDLHLAGLAPVRRGHVTLLIGVEVQADGSVDVDATDPRTGAAAHARFRHAARVRGERAP